MQRNIKVDILPPDLETRKKVVDAIRLYQAACRQAYSWCATAEMAGAEIKLVDKEGKPDVRVLPVTDRSKKIMELITGKENKGTFYQIRTLVHELHPSWTYLVPESIEHDIVPKKWMAKDIEFPEAKRGYLTLNGAREFARFSRIGIHFKNTTIKADERSVTLNWDKDIGPVTFEVIDMDPSRWGVWRNLCSGTDGWKFGCMYLQEDEAKLRVVVSYTCPDKDQILDTSKPLYVEFGTTPELYITMRTDQVYKGDVLSVVGALEWRKEMEAIRKKMDLRKASYGSLNKKWGGRTGWRAMIKKSNRLTDRIANGVQNHNHLWTRRIANAAVRYSAGRVIVVNMPKEQLFGMPWGWYQFKQMLTYKVKEIGGKVEYATVPELSKAIAA